MNALCWIMFGVGIAVGAALVLVAVKAVASMPEDDRGD